MQQESKLYIQDIYMTKLGRTRTTRILLPKAYFKYPEAKFPVIYMLDGQNLFDKSTAFDQPWNLQQAMDSLPLKDQCIIVGIDNGKEWRIREYLPTNFGSRIGEGELFIDFLVNELKPKVDSHLRTLTDSSHTIIGGSSMGGLLAFYAVTRYSQVFGKAMVLSPAFWIYPTILQWEEKSHGKIRVIGSKTESKSMTDTLSKTYNALTKKGYSSNEIWVEIKDRGRHNEIFWGRQFANSLKWLMS